MKKLVVLSLLLVFVLASYAQQGSRWEKEISAFEQQDAQKPLRKKLILFTGSSSIRRWEDLSSYFPGKQVLNRGFGGSQASDLLQYADRITGQHKIKQILIYEGDNDLASGKTVDRVVGDLKQIVIHYQEKYPKATVSFLSVKPSPARLQYIPQIKEVNEQMKAFMLSRRKAQFIDVFSPLLREDGNPKPEIFVSDGIHMNAQGYQLWAAAIAPYLK